MGEMGEYVIRTLLGEGRIKCKPPLTPTPEELLQRIEALENHTHTYRTGIGEGHNNAEAETRAAEVQAD